MAVTKVVMPKLSEAMETGKLLRWLKQEGDRVSGGDIIAEIETDKADIELEAFGSGVLRKLLATPGTAVPVGGLIAVIADPDDDISALVGGGAPAPKARPPRLRHPRRRPPPRRRRPRRRRPRPLRRRRPRQWPCPPRRGTAPPRRAAVAAPAAAVLAGGRLRVSPLARKLAQRAGVDLTRVTGTGPSGRIIQRDIEAFVARASGGRAGAAGGGHARARPRPGRAPRPRTSR